MKTRDLHYLLPDSLIARHPTTDRDASRLMVVRRDSGQIVHAHFRDLDQWLRCGDCLVLNSTRVRKARTYGRRQSGGAVEILWLRPSGSDHDWLALIRPSRRLRAGEIIRLESGDDVAIVGFEGAGQARVRTVSGRNVETLLESAGHVPLPPYLGRQEEPEDAERYQTVYARDPGAVAAPTAGLHFTSRLLERLAKSGIQIADLTLHVGPGTFTPMRAERVSDHHLDAEWFNLPAATRRKTESARANGHRAVAVGTTAVRTLEAAARLDRGSGTLSGWTDLFISPPFEFRATDAVVTNFHLPRSSLLALVAAFAGLDLVLDAYQMAVKEQYRFYSYGDAMLIL